MLLVQSTQSSQLQPTRLPPIMLVKVGSERLSWLNTWWHWSAYRGYFQVIEWIQQPTDINALREFEVWKKKCDVKVSCFITFNIDKQLTVFCNTRDNHSVPYQTPAPSQQENCRGRRWGFTPASSVPIITRGSWTPQETVSVSKCFTIIYHQCLKFVFHNQLVDPNICMMGRQQTFHNV